MSSVYSQALSLPTDLSLVTAEELGRVWGEAHARGEGESVRMEVKDGALTRILWNMTRLFLEKDEVKDEDLGELTEVFEPKILRSTYEKLPFNAKYANTFDVFCRALASASHK